MSSNKKSTGAWGVDFSDPEQAANVLEQLGGEALLKTKYPAVYRAFLKTCDHASKGLCNWDDSDDDVHSGLYCDAPTCAETESGEISLYAKVYFQGNYKKYLYLHAAGDLVSLESPRRQYDSFDALIDNRNFEHTLNCRIKSQKEINNRTLKLRFGFLGLTRGGYLNVADQSIETILYINGGPTVTAMTVDDPRSKKEIPNNPIRVYYARTPGDKEGADYIDNNNKEENGYLKLILPIKGSITISPLLTFLELNENTKKEKFYPTMIYGGDGVVQYAIPFQQYNEIFQYDAKEHKISYQIPDDWANKIATTRFKIVSGKDLQFQLVISLWLKAVNGARIPVVAQVASMPLVIGENFYELSKTPGMAKVPNIRLIFGCFSRDTFIKMSNGDNRRIDEIQQGDMVLNANGLPVQVNDIITGYEEELVCIQTVNGRELRVTTGHPVLCQGTLKSASNIAPGEKLTLDDGTLDTVKFIFLQPYQDQIYSLVTSEKGEMLIANGLIAGDFSMQNSFVEPEPETAQEPLTAEEEELLNQFKLLMEELKHK